MKKHLPSVAWSSSAAAPPAGSAPPCWPARSARGCPIRLVESDAIGTVGVGEATIPQIQHINQFLGLDEREVLKASHGTYKLGIQFNDWGRLGDAYLHAFGDIGLPHGLDPLPALLAAGCAGPRTTPRTCGPTRPTPAPAWTGAWRSPIASADSPMTGAAPRLPPGRRPLCAIPAPAMRPRGRPAHRRQGRRRETARRGRLHRVGAAGERRAGRGRPVHRLLGLSRPADRAGAGYRLRELAATGCRAIARRWWPARGCRRCGPYTQASARDAGWQWRIPLQHRSGNGHVYCSDFISDDEATATLLANLEGEALGEPRVLRFVTGAPQALLAPQLRRHRPVRRLHGTAGIDRHPPDPVRASAGCWRCFPDRRFDPALIGGLQPRHALRVRTHPRFPDPALRHHRAPTTRRSGATARRWTARTACATSWRYSAPADRSSARPTSCSPKSAGCR